MPSEQFYYTVISFILFFVILCWADPSQQYSSKHQKISNFSTNSRTGKFLNLFSVIRFSNPPCSTRNGLNGTCYTEKQCAGNPEKINFIGESVKKKVNRQLVMIGIMP